MRFLIIFRDVHHGNGIQDIFYSNPNVFYFSVHRYEHEPGLYFSDDGKIDRVGEGPGLGTNINVPLHYSEDGYFDADYEAIFDEVLLPAAAEFHPDFVIIACGFDSADGDPVGKFHVSPQGYTRLLKKIQTISKKVVLVLEGGYNPQVVADCTEACIRFLVEPNLEEDQKPSKEIQQQTKIIIEEVKAVQSPYWSSL